MEKRQFQSSLNEREREQFSAGLSRGPGIPHAHPECLNDITIGANDGVGCFDANGFAAARGWDAATGLGTPVFGCLAAAALGLD